VGRHGPQDGHGRRAVLRPLVNPLSQQFGRASGTIVQSFMGIMGSLPPGSNVDYAYFNFSNGNPFTGAARGYGYAGKVGLVYQATDRLTFGLTYHNESALGDLEASGSQMSFQLDIPGMGKMAQTLTGTMRVNNFEWPALLGAGLAFRPDDRWLLVADVRRVFWQNVMKDFSMTFRRPTPPRQRRLRRPGAQRHAVPGLVGPDHRPARRRPPGDRPPDPPRRRQLHQRPDPGQVPQLPLPGHGGNAPDRRVRLEVRRAQQLRRLADLRLRVEQTNGYGIRITHAQTEHPDPVQLPVRTDPRPNA
jgi:hypothetical protein